MKKYVWDISFILLLTIILVGLNESGHSDLLMKFPFITIYGAYLFGRLTGALGFK